VPIIYSYKYIIYHIQYIYIFPCFCHTWTSMNPSWVELVWTWDTAKFGGFSYPFPMENVRDYEFFHCFSPCLNSPPSVSSPFVIQTPWGAGHQQDMLLTVQHLATSELHYSPSRCWGIHFSSLVWWFFITRNARKWRKKSMISYPITLHKEQLGVCFMLLTS
jgi:hypothetical protein